MLLLMRSDAMLKLLLRELDSRNFMFIGSGKARELRRMQREENGTERNGTERNAEPVSGESHLSSRRSRSVADDDDDDDSYDDDDEHEYGDGEQFALRQLTRRDQTIRYETSSR